MVLSDKFFQQAAGWEVVMQARALLAGGRVLSASYAPPLLQGSVVVGDSSLKTGLVIRSASDIDNLCPCRDARERGIICAHAVAVGLHLIQPAPAKAPPTPAAGPRPTAGLAGKPSSPATAAPSRPAREPVKLRRSLTGEPLSIQILLPPNLPELLGNGPQARFSIVFEGATGRARSPLNALAKAGPFKLDAADERLLDRAEEVAGGDTPGLAQLSLEAWTRLLPALVDHPRVTLGRAQPVTVSGTALAVPLHAAADASGEITLSLRPTPGAPPPRWWSVPGLPAWALVRLPNRPPTFSPVALPEPLWDLTVQPRRFTRLQVPDFLTRFWPALTSAGQTSANFQPDDFQLIPGKPQLRAELRGGLAGLGAKVSAQYGARSFVLGSTTTDSAAWLPDPGDVRRYTTRDLAAESGAVQRLRQAGFGGPDAQGLWQLTGQERVLRFFGRDYPVWQKLWTVTLDEQLEHSTRKNLERVTPEFRVTPSGTQWFDLEVRYQGDSGERFSAAEVQQWIRGGGSRRLRNGKFAVLDTGAVEELQEVLLDCAPEQSGGSDGQSTRFRMLAAQGGYLDAAVANAGFELKAPTDWSSGVRNQTGDAQMVCPPLGSREAILRPYQKDGVAWLGFLREHGFGGVLADEMGLGKTLQVLAHLAAVRTAKPGLPPCLVVCPTTLVFNWAAEAKKFTPELRVLILDGPRRHERFASIPQHDLVVTSYALIRRDADRYPEFIWDTIALDEAQHIKNRRTQNAVAVKRLRSAHRLVLTGTPLENSVFDLWSLYDFLMPGYLGKADDFRERYEVPIAREQDAAVMTRLNRRLRPFLRRRLKRDVAKDLPAKLEQVSYCELNDDQAAAYRQLLDATRREVLAAGERGLAQGRMLVLTALLRLRQVCCDLRLLKPAGERVAEPGEPASVVEEADVEVSGKFAVFTELLDEILDGGHRVLVFSQFTTMLALLREHLDATGTAYCYLDGSTKDRGAVVEKFQNDAQIPVFLISLKAGGVGLNLTAADTVIHFDPWWNPAVEDQATDRAHRLGQTRVVTSYKLITRGTVEEKILALQQKKRAVIAATLTDEEAFTGSLSWAEIQELLS